MTFPSGKRWEGNFEDGILQGFGTEMISADQPVRLVEFKDGKIVRYYD